MIDPVEMERNCLLASRPTRKVDTRGKRWVSIISN
jgi:hypothetical protein